MVAVRGPGEAGEAVAEVLPVEEIGAVGEDDVVCNEAFPGCGGGGDEENGAGAEAEEEERAAPAGELREGAVERGIEEEEEEVDVA